MLAAMSLTPIRDSHAMLSHVRQQWGGQSDLWVFGYASLIWRPEFDAAEHRPALVRGWHRAFKMRSRVNRGSPEQPGLVYALVSGGMCRGMVYRIPHQQAADELPRLWHREMPNGVYDPKWLRCRTAGGDVTALAFTLSRRSPNHTGVLSEDQYRRIFSSACGRYGTTRDYAQLTYDKLRLLGINDQALGRLLELVNRK